MFVAIFVKPTPNCTAGFKGVKSCDIKTISGAEFACGEVPIMAHPIILLSRER